MDCNATTAAIVGDVQEISSDSDTAVYLIYALIVPILGTFGFLTNLINAIIFMRPRMTPSAFTYLAAMSWMDCISCFLMVFSGFSRSVFRNRKLWIHYDYKVQIPLIGITTGAANLILVSATLDRLFYLKSCLPQGAPRFCTRSTARQVVAGLIVFSALINIPYFFIFAEKENGQIRTTKFFHSTYYMVHNWISFILLAIFPAVFLLIANAIMISIIRKWSNCRQLRAANGQARDQKRYSYQTKLTITIVVVIFLFVIGELPSHLTAKKSAMNLLYGGDITKFDFGSMEIIRASFTILNLIQLSLNIVIYAVINPAFMIEFFECFQRIFDWCHKAAGINCMQRSCGNFKEFLFKRFDNKISNKSKISNNEENKCTSLQCQKTRDKPRKNLFPRLPSESVSKESESEVTEVKSVHRVKSCSALATIEPERYLSQPRRSLPSPKLEPSQDLSNFSILEMQEQDER